MLAVKDYDSAPAFSSVAFFNRGEGLYQTGGYLYNRHVREAMTDAGLMVQVYENADELIRLNAHHRIIIDSLMMPELAPIILHENLSPVLLYHLPPDMTRLAADTDNQVKEAELQSQIIVTGDVSFEHMQKRLAGSNIAIHKIEPGVPVSWRRKTHQPLADVASPLKLLMIASYQPGKGLDKLPEILSAIKKLPWTLEVIGESELCPMFKCNLQQQLSDLGLSEKVRLRGPQKHQGINQAMLEADLLLQLSSFETYSMVTAEAIAAGLPVLSTPTGNQRSFAISGKVKYLASFNTKDIVTELSRLLQDSSAWPSLWRSEFKNVRTWDRVKQEFLEVIGTGHYNSTPNKPIKQQEPMNNGI